MLFLKHHQNNKSYSIITLFVFFILLALCVQKTFGKSVIFANYWNVVLFYPIEYGGNDDIRIIFDIRNITTTAFKYTPIIVDVAYESSQNIAFCYLESAITSYIVLIKWFGGKWCYQIIFEFASSTYSNYMYHSLVTLDNFVYWTNDRYIFSGRIPGYEQRRLMQPGWERIYRMTIDKPKKMLYVASYDFGENGIYACSILSYSCTRLTSTYFAINSIHFDSGTDQLYIASVQAQFLFRYSAQYKGITPVTNVKTTASDALVSGNFGLFVNRETISICNDTTLPNCIREARPRLVDPYTLQYVFTFDHINDFDAYPYPYSDFHDVLWKDKQYLFHLHILGIDYVDNDYAFLPEMDLNSNFLNVQTCSNIFNDDRQRILIPAVIAAGAVLIVSIIAIIICAYVNQKHVKIIEIKNVVSGSLKAESKTASNLSTVSGSTYKQPLNSKPKQKTKILKNNKSKSKISKSGSGMVENDDTISYDTHQYDQRISRNPQIEMGGGGGGKQPKVHSTGIYIIGKNKAFDGESDVYNNNTEFSGSYLQPRVDQRLRSKPVPTTMKSRLDARIDINPVPLSIDSKRSYEEYLENALHLNGGSNTTSASTESSSHHHHSRPQKVNYVSSCHIPLYGSSNTDNYISIKKAVDYDSPTNSSNSDYNNHNNHRYHQSNNTDKRKINIALV